MYKICTFYLNVFTLLHNRLFCCNGNNNFHQLNAIQIPYMYNIVTKLILYRIDTSSNEKCVYTYSKVDLGRIGGFILCVICSTYNIDVIGHKHNENIYPGPISCFRFPVLLHCLMLVSVWLGSKLPFLWINLSKMSWRELKQPEKEESEIPFQGKCSWYGSLCTHKQA